VQTLILILLLVAILALLSAAVQRWIAGLRRVWLLPPLL
jgi:hypothetical protein